MGLYDEENAQVTSGELDLPEYWEARAVAAQLADALATKQPWNAIAAWLPGAITKLELLLAGYPNHREALGWLEQARGIDATVDPEYDRRWARGFPWEQETFRKGWVSLHLARAARAKSPPDWRRVFVEARKVPVQLERCFNVHEWPEAARELLVAGPAEAARLEAEARPHAG